jgi:dTDP-glucose pyrophosphorylase
MPKPLFLVQGKSILEHIVENPSTYGVAKLVGDKIFEFVEKPLIGKEPSSS